MLWGHRDPVERLAHVSAAVSNELLTVWRQLARRNEWELANDEAALFARAMAEYDALPDDAPAHKRARLALLRAYGALLYEGLRERDDRAAYELWLACYRLALRDGQAERQAEQLAQETIARVIERLHTLRAPHSIIPWALRIYRTARRTLQAQERDEEPLPSSDEQPADEPAEPQDMAEEVEQRLLGQQIVSIIDARLPNPLERVVLLRVVLLGDHPRDVARDLDLPLHRTRLAKSRALQRLRAAPEILQLLGDSDDDSARAIGTGAYPDDA